MTKTWVFCTDLEQRGSPRLGVLDSQPTTESRRPSTPNTKVGVLEKGKLFLVDGGREYFRRRCQESMTGPHGPTGRKEVLLKKPRSIVGPLVSKTARLQKLSFRAIQE